MLLGLKSPETSDPRELKELFIEELTEVHGGSDGPFDKVRDLLLTTYGCCEEGPASCC